MASPDFLPDVDHEELVDEGSNIAYCLLGPPHIDSKTGRFKPGHDARVEVARATLEQHLGFPAHTAEASIALAEDLARDAVRLIMDSELRDQQGFRRQLGA